MVVTMFYSAGPGIRVRREALGSGNGKPLVSLTGTIRGPPGGRSAKIAGRIAERPVLRATPVLDGQIIVRLDGGREAAECRLRKMRGGPLSPP